MQDLFFFFFLIRNIVVKPFKISYCLCQDSSALWLILHIDSNIAI